MRKITKKAELWSIRGQRSIILCGFFVSPERSSERDYVITDSVCSRAYVYVVCVYVCGNFCKIDHCIIDVFPWDLDTMILR